MTSGPCRGVELHYGRTKTYAQQIVPTLSPIGGMLKILWMLGSESFPSIDMGVSKNEATPTWMVYSGQFH